MRINDIIQKLGVEVVADAITLKDTDESRWFVTSVSEGFSFGEREKYVSLLGHSKELGCLELTIRSSGEEQVTNLNSILKTFNKGEI